MSRHSHRPVPRPFAPFASWTDAPVDRDAARLAADLGYAAQDETRPLPTTPITRTTRAARTTPSVAEACRRPAAG